MAHQNRHIRPTVFKYLTYRAFLAAWFDWIKQVQPIKTRRWHALQIGISSGHLTNILHGQRELSKDIIGVLLPMMDLSSNEHSYFLGLVRLDASNSPKERKAILDELFANPSWRRTVKLDSTQTDYLSHWLLVTIRELATQEGFCATPEWINPRLTFPVGAEEIHAALATLLRLRLIQQSNGSLAAGDVMITTEQDDEGQALYSYHKSMLNLALDGLERIPYEQRMFVGVTLSLNADQLERFRGELFALIQRMAEEVELARSVCSDPADVVQICAQLFPLAYRCPRGG